MTHPYLEEVEEEEEMVEELVGWSHSCWRASSGVILDAGSHLQEGKTSIRGKF